MEKFLKSFSSHALHESHTKVKVSDNLTQWDSVAPSKNFTIIYILFSIKVFLLVTKHKPEAIEQQGELKSVHSTLSHLQSPTEWMQSQYNYGSFLSKSDLHGTILYTCSACPKLPKG